MLLVDDEIWEDEHVKVIDGGGGCSSIEEVKL
jgi:hypothetical protein